MRMTQLILQDSKQIRNNVDPLLQQADPLIHLQVASHSLIHRLKLWFCPHELGRVENRALKMNVDAEDEELADLHVNLAPGEIDATGPRNGAGY